MKSLAQHIGLRPTSLTPGTLDAMATKLIPAFRGRLKNEMETNLTKIKQLSKKNERTNLKFRSFLKNYDHPDKIDALVQQLFIEISSKIDCKQCANCCTLIGPLLHKNDIDNLSLFLKISNEEFINNFLEKDDEDDLTFKNLPCIFLKDNLCTCYSIRPEDCKSYPHLHKDEFIFRLFGVIA